MVSLVLLLLELLFESIALLGGFVRVCNVAGGGTVLLARVTHDKVLIDIGGLAVSASMGQHHALRLVLQVKRLSDELLNHGLIPQTLLSLFFA